VHAQGITLSTMLHDHEFRGAGVPLFQELNRCDTYNFETLVLNFLKNPGVCCITEMKKKGFQPSM
jgi:hypothetical protein